MIPYSLLTLLASVGLTLHHVAVTHASRGSKLAVAIALAVALVIWWNCFQWQWRVVGMVLQAGICVYALVYLKAHSHHA